MPESATIAIQKVRTTSGRFTSRGTNEEFCSETSWWDGGAAPGRSLRAIARQRNVELRAAPAAAPAAGARADTAVDCAADPSADSMLFGARLAAYTGRMPAQAPRRAAAAALTLLAMLSAGCAALSSMKGSSPDFAATRRAAPDDTDLGLARFALDDFGTLNTHTLETVASPWKLYSTALLLSSAPALGLPIEHASIRPVLEHFGFLFPDSIGNWDPRLGPAPRFTDVAVGQTRAMIHGWIPGIGLEVRNTGCATCHTGVVYDAGGAPTRAGWIGLPSVSIDLEDYAQAVFAGLKLGMKNEKQFFATMQHVHPDMGWGERYAYRHFVLPRLRRALPEIVAARDRALAFNNGGPGLTNGVAAIKLQLGLISRRGYAAGEMALTSIPDLADRQYRSSVLFDGTYTPRGGERFESISRDRATSEHVERLADVIAFFTMGTAGNDAASAERAIPHMREVMRWIGYYRPPPFPGAVDTALAARGAGVFAQRCARCHGHFEEQEGRPRLIEYPNRLVRQEQIGTDSVRWRSVDDAVLAWQAGHPDHPFTRHVDAARTGGYVPPILTGVWSTAPYLHNGSVPTLWHMMHPAERPARFEVGGHRLDFDRMGIALAPDSGGVWRYPAAYRARSISVIYDTSLPGRSNRGHEFPFSSMSEDEKRAVLEYLKRL
jgi:mono/diheme cytochrome c family protein